MASTIPSSYIPLSHYGIIKMSGEDAETYLQGQITNDVTALTDEKAQIACQCDAKGKVWSVFYLLKQQNDYLLVGPKDSLENSFNAFKKFAVFSKVVITEASESLHLYGLQDNQAPELPDSAMAVRQTAEGSIFKLPGSSRRFILISKGLAEEAHSEEQLLNWQITDIAEGIPFISGAASNEYIPQMLNVQALDGISFTKGCYMGQETVARTRYLGKNKRAGFILEGQSDSDISAQDAIERQLGENWRRAGTIANHVWDHQTKSLWIYAVLPNDIETDSLLRLKNQPEVQLSIHPLPYSVEE